MAPHWGMPSAHAVFLPLTATDERGERVGRLARSWEHSSDYREWTVRLLSDVRWHDGVPVTAHDVAWTLEFLRHPDVLHEPPDAYDLTVLDDTTYTIRYRTGATRAPWTATPSTIPATCWRGSTRRSTPAGSSGPVRWGTARTGTCATSVA